ncbi:MAG: ArsC/Spx/MgsR family protein, partial [Maricaulaceae bacterium]
NPKCSTSRHALELLEARGANVEVVEYLKTPPSPAHLTAILKKMGAGPDAILRTRNAPEDALAAWEAASTKSAKIAALSAHPILIERPIVVAGEKAALIRPKAEAEEILSALGV